MEERKKIYEIFCNSINFKEKKAHSTIIKSKRKLTQEQVFMIYVNNEQNIIPKTYLCNMFNITSNTIYTILNQKSYQDYWQDYQKLTNDQKEQLASLLRKQQQQTP